MEAFIGLASNLRPEANLVAAMAAVRQLGIVVSQSRTYRSAAIGTPGEPDYLNAACHLRTSLAAASLRDELKRIERSLGRRPISGPVAIDLDLLLVDEATGPPPHPDLLERPSVALAMAEVAPSRTHPLTGETFEKIASRVRGENGEAAPYQGSERPS